MRVTLNRYEPFRGISSFQDQINRFFHEALERNSEEGSITTWAPAVDIRMENDILTIRGERKFEKKVNESNYLRIERNYGSFSRSFSLTNTVNTEAIKAEYKDGVLTLRVPKREEAKPKQIKVNVEAPAMAAVAGR